MDLGVSFQKKGAQPPADNFPTLDTSSLERRIRTLEEGIANLRKIVQVTEENILVKNRHTSTEFKTLTSDINELRREINELRDKMLMAIKEMQTLARQDDVKVIERYVNLWDPVKFVTQGEIEEIVKSILEREMRKEKDDGRKE